MGEAGVWLEAGQVNCRQTQVYTRKLLIATFQLLINNLLFCSLPHKAINLAVYTGG
jgi:hypothetical protein